MIFARAGCGKTFSVGKRQHARHEGLSGCWAGGPVIVSKWEYSPKSSSVYTSLKHVATSSLRVASCVKSVSSNCMEDPKPKKASPKVPV